MGAMKCSENSATCFFPIMSTWEFALNDVETDQCWLIQSSWAFATWGWIKQPCKWKAVQDSTFWLQTFRERLPFSTMLVMSKKDLLPNYNHLLPLRPFTLEKTKLFPAVVLEAFYYLSCRQRFLSVGIHESGQVMNGLMGWTSAGAP